MMEKNERFLIAKWIMAPDGVMLPSFYNWDNRTHELSDGTHVNVDGGINEIYSHNSSVPFWNMNVYSDDLFEVQRRFVCRYNAKHRPHMWTPLFQMSNNWLENVIEYNNEHSLTNDNDLKARFFHSLYKKELEYRKLNNIKIEE